MAIIDFTEYIKAINDTADYDEKWNIIYPSLGLGEAGEVQNQIKKILRDDAGILTDTRKEKIEKELGDLFWNTVKLCLDCGLDPNEVVQKNADKLADRKLRGVIRGDGDDR